MDSFVWVISMGIPILFLVHGWLFAKDKYPSELELIVFQFVSAGCGCFVIVWRSIRPIEMFWIPTNRY